MPLFEGLGFGSEKTAIILDIGTAYTKCGFAGETGPRAIVPSQVKRARSGKVCSVAKYENEDDLRDILLDFIHMLYFRHLLVNPKERRVVVVESILTPSNFRNVVAKMLFNHFEVPSVLFAPSHLVALFTLGIPSGLVMDVGYNEALVIPVYEGTPILKAWEAMPLAARAIHNYLEAQLLETSLVRTDQADEKPLSSIMEKVDENIVEDIKVRCCFVTTFSRSQEILESKRENDPDKMPKPPPAVEYPLDGNKILQIEGKIREHSAEVLFEQDSEERSLATLILDAILKCPIDMRKMMADNVVIMGGTAMLPGFHHRLMLEIQELLRHSKYENNLAFKTVYFHQPPAKENYVAWLGGSILGALEVLASRSVAKETYQQTGKIPDWSSLAAPEEDKSMLHVRR